MVSGTILKCQLVGFFVSTFNPSTCLKIASARVFCFLISYSHVTVVPL